MKKLLSISLFCAFLFAGSGSLWAGDAKAGKELATTCMACHGEKGISEMSEIPNLAGQQEDYLVIAIKGYKDGTRNNDVMSASVESVTDKDVENLAAYFSSLECK